MNETETKWSSLYKFWILIEFQIKRIFRTWTTFFIIAGPFGLLVLTSWIMPPQQLMYQLIGVGIVAASFFKFGNTYREWKTSKNMFSNMSFIGYSNKIVLSSLIVFNVIWSFIGVLNYLLLSWFWFVLLGNTFLTPSADLFLESFNWPFVLYFSIVTIFTSIGVALFFDSISKKDSTYAIWAGSYIWMMIMIGGFLNDSNLAIMQSREGTFIRYIQAIFPNWYINYMAISVFNYNTIFYWSGDVWYNAALIVPWVYAIFLYTVSAVINLKKTRSIR